MKSLKPTRGTGFCCTGSHVTSMLSAVIFTTCNNGASGAEKKRYHDVQKKKTFNDLRRTVNLPRDNTKTTFALTYFSIFIS